MDEKEIKRTTDPRKKSGVGKKRQQSAESATPGVIRPHGD